MSTVSTATSSARQDSGPQTKGTEQAAGKRAEGIRASGGEGIYSALPPRYGTRSQTLIRRLDFLALRKREEGLHSVCLPVRQPSLRYSDFIIDLVEVGGEE